MAEWQAQSHHCPHPGCTHQCIVIIKEEEPPPKVETYFYS
jgi:hypothetical protein